MKKLNKSRGFSLLELILVLGLSSLAFLAFLNTEKKRTEVLTCEAGGQQFEEVGKALGSYIAREKLNLLANIPANSTQVIPFNVLKNITVAPYTGRPFLPDTFSTQNIFGNNYVLAINRTLSGDRLTGLVISSAAVTDASGAVKYDCLGAAMKKAGAASGMTFMSTNTLSGLNGAWTLPSTTFAQINAMGQFGYRAASQNNQDDLYLRIDGTNQMIGNLNAGNYNVNNVTDLSYTGWLYGNNALINALKTGYIENAGNIKNAGNIENNIKIGTRTLSGFDYNAASPGNADLFINNDSNKNVVIGSGFGGVTSSTYPTLPASPNGDGNLYVKDIYVAGSSSNRVINSWLSDRLPKYSSRGAILVNVDSAGNNLDPTTGNPVIVSSVACGTGGAPKIEVIPQVVWVQGRVEGDPALGANIGTGTPGNGFGLGYYNGPFGIHVQGYQDQWSRGGFAAYASNVPGGWRVHLTTGAYNAAYVGGTVLAHVYCDFGN